jgi:hypothetical protein
LEFVIYLYFGACAKLKGDEKMDLSIIATIGFTTAALIGIIVLFIISSRGSK